MIKAAPERRLEKDGTDFRPHPDARPGAEFSPRPANDSPPQKEPDQESPDQASNPRPGRRKGRYKALLIGASTGGPHALLVVLGGLPASFPLPILVVQHISKGFAKGLAGWLGRLTGREVKTGLPGEELRPGVVYLAPDDRHLEIARRMRVRISDDPPLYSVRPSVTRLFESGAKALGPDVIGVLLTGMGRDGAEGLRSIRLAGGLTIVQDAATSLIHGMPKAAISLGAAMRVAPVGEIAGLIMRAISGELRDS